MTRQWLLLPALLLGAPVPASAQGVPDTDVFVAPLRWQNGQHTVGEPVNLTARPGYDNQPWFFPDGSSLFYVSQRSGQTDVFRHDLVRNTVTQVTHTPESEYSPAPDAGRTRHDGCPCGSGLQPAPVAFHPQGKPLRRAPGDVTGVGYYAWGDRNTLALFIADSVQSFVLSDVRTGRATRIGGRLGGSPPRAIPGQYAVSFMQQDSAGTWGIQRLDLRTRQATPLVKAQPGVHYTWTPRGTLLMARGATLYEWSPTGDRAWREIATFSAAGLQSITRIAVSLRGDRIAFGFSIHTSDNPMKLRSLFVDCSLLAATHVAAQSCPWFPERGGCRSELDNRLAFWPLPRQHLRLLCERPVPPERAASGAGAGVSPRELAHGLWADGAFLEALARTAPQRVKVFPYGKSVEQQTMYLVAIGNEANIARLPEIQGNIQRLADPRRTSSAQAGTVISQSPVVVWVNSANDGNETAAFEAAIQLAYQLAAGEDARTRAMREGASADQPGPQPGKP